jgi:bifunctional enzyme CysN/CysC
LSRPHDHRGLLRFITCGSVDDGKSTLIGRFLHDAGGVYEDQLAAVAQASSQNRGSIDFSLITDGLKAEREQAITIDVAYRYFSTPARKFIIADTPGHEQYTRNMITGASTSDLAILLVDARKGILQQTRRHAYLVWLLGIKHIILAVNKMDLVGFDPAVFNEVREKFQEFTRFMTNIRMYSVPISALNGDNVVLPSASMPWYAGPSLLQLLESVPVEDDRNFTDLRFSIQLVIRPEQDFRGYAGQVLSGVLKPGQEVVALPSGRSTRVDRIFLYETELERAFAPQSVLVTLKDHIDLARGDMLVDPERLPIVSSGLRAELVWLSATQLRCNRPYLIKHASQILCGTVTRIVHKLELSNLRHSPAESLALNEIATVEIRTHKPMFFDPYIACRHMGNFIMIDSVTNETVGAGILLEKAASPAMLDAADCATSIRSENNSGITVWFTGLSGAGKTTICSAVATELLARGFAVEVLDGDAIRAHLCSDLRFTRKDRDENIRRIGFIAELLVRHGVIVLVSAISPYRAARDQVRATIPNFIEVFVDAPVGVCEQRDPKGLYRKARAALISGFTGIDDPYEQPLAPEVHCCTDRESIQRSTAKVLAAVLETLSRPGSEAMGVTTSARA